ncbi:YciI family protein [Streptomyces sp. NPDC019443]|uniref:YciI family protein n=1 Tax=Streptomyces sp. NPDC019443 TaxID=3365061 RepID=UPI003798FCBF
MTDEEMQQSHKQVGIIEQEMKSAGAWVFSGRLHGPDTATVVRMSDGKVLTTDGPFAESREHLGGFYIIEAPDLDAAIAWASKVTDAIKAPIERRPPSCRQRCRHHLGSCRRAGHRLTSSIADRSYHSSGVLLNAHYAHCAQN